MSKYSTAKLIGVLESTVTNYHAGLYPDMKWIDEDVINAIIARLRAADTLKDALRRIADGQWPQTIAETEGTLAMRQVARKAIADYERKE